ncbi:MAG TPA: hypothetical protein VFJ19_20710 [Nocardioidaceae bacterium]|nr:hypothetical protein [Nocardioidaceae bacterium]
MRGTDEDARARFREIALTQLDEIRRKRTEGDDLGLASLTIAYQARLEAFAAGSWDDPRVQETLGDLLKFKTTGNQRGSSGYLRPAQGSWDAFGDGSPNTADTVYSVTLADHVGPTVLDAVSHGVLPETEAYFVVDALLALPVHQSPFGDYLPYSDSPTDQAFATVNVSVGAAAFLQQAMDAGISRPGQRELIDRLSPLAGATYEVEMPHWWPYAYCTDPDNPRYGVGWVRDPAEQDWNHEAYTAETADVLGLPVAETALDYHLHHPVYDPLGRPVTGRRARDVMGRLRMEYLRPGYNPRNTITDAQWYYRTWRDDPSFDAAQNAQLGLWCSRLAENADALALADFGVGSLDPATAHPHPATPGEPVRISSTVRNHGGVPIVDKQVWLRLAGAQDETLATVHTGLRGEAEFTVTMSDHEVCYRVVAADGVASERVCVALLA